MIKFTYNVDKDAENWVNTVQDTSPSWGINYAEETKMVPEVLKAKILKLNKEKAVVAVKEYFESQPRFQAKKEVITAEIRSIEAVWKGKEQEFFSALETLTNKPVFSSEFTAYFTTMFICPYDKEKYRWFMLSM
ncbi:hypothetical protein J7K24_00935 [bacterium]|nr:hypothetical protein [bacterium]